MGFKKPETRINHCFTGAKVNTEMPPICSWFCWRTLGGNYLSWASRSGPFLWTPPLSSLFLVCNNPLESTFECGPLTALVCQPGRWRPCTAVASHCIMTPTVFAGMNTENTESQRMNKIMSEIQALQEVVTRFRQMRLDATEFACLKCIVTFKAGELYYLTAYFTAV